ncbi:MAG: excinuclease ABC subunit A, partial [Cytophagales bacterium]
MPVLEDFDSIDPKNNIIIKNARVNNLKNLSVSIPRNKLVVVTGVSGSGKSSLAFDTLFAEGQRMYVESLNSYARQFLGRMEKPDVDYIRGVSPAIAIEQKVSSKNPRSTVGTTTEIYDYLKLLFARIGRTFSPISGIEVKKDTVTDVIAWINQHADAERFMVLAPYQIKQGRKSEDELNILLQKGFTRLWVNEKLVQIEELLESKDYTSLIKPFALLIDRTSVDKENEESQFRLSDSILTAFFEGEGICIIDFAGKEKQAFSDKFEADGMAFEEPTINLFAFNNPYG